MRILQILLIGGLLFMSTNLAAQNQRTVGEAWLVQLDEQAEAARVLRGLEHTSVVPALRLYRVVAPADWQPGPGIRHFQRNYAITFRDSVPNDPAYGQQDFYQQINAERVWAINTGGTGTDGRRIVVAVIDSGFDTAHVDLRPNLWRNPDEIAGNGLDDDGNGLPDDVHGWNFKRNTSTFGLYKDHGTGVAGIVGASGNNGINGTGLNWNVDLMLLQGEDILSIAASVNYIYEQRRRWNESRGTAGSFVVAANFSLGFESRYCSDEPIWNELMNLLGETGILPVAATANSRHDVDEVGDLPTSCESPYLIAVAAEDRRNGLTSGFGGSSVDLAAPGLDIYTIRNFNRSEDDALGTSYAAPLVSGTVALLYAMPCEQLLAYTDDDPAAAALAIRRAILDGVKPVSVPGSQTVTGGSLDVYGALERLHDFCVSPAALRNTPLDYLSRRAVLWAYPNPVRTELTVELGTFGFGEVRVLVHDMLGREVDARGLTSTLFAPQRVRFDTRAWLPGVYQLTVWNGRTTESLGIVKVE